MTAEFVDASAPRGSRRIIAVLLLISPLDQIGFDLYAPAMPIISDEFDVGNAVVQNTVTVYLLGMTLVVLPAGLLADALGRKRLLLTGLSVVALTGVGCAVARSIDVMLLLRFVQGIGAGTCLLLAATIAADCFRGARLVSVLGMLGAAWGAAPVLAPAIGGFVVEFASWRWVFALLATIAALLAIAVAAALPETLPPGRRAPVDLRESRLVIGDAIRHPVFVAFVTMFGLVAAAQSMFGVVAPFLYQDLFGFSAGQYGVIALVVGTANLLGAMTCGWLAQRMQARTLALVAWALLVAGALILALTARQFGDAAWLVVTGGGALMMLGIGVLDPLTKGFAMGVFTRHVGLLTGLITAICYLFTTGAMALVAYLPETSAAPMAWCCLAIALVLIVLMVTSVSRPAHSHRMGSLRSALCDGDAVRAEG